MFIVNYMQKPSTTNDHLQRATQEVAKLQKYNVTKLS